MTEGLDRLQGVLGGLPRLAVAVSGGVDSLTLAHVASRLAGLELQVLHAVGPAVPAGRWGLPDAYDRARFESAQVTADLRDPRCCELRHGPQRRAGGADG